MSSGPGAVANLTSYDEAALCSTAFRFVHTPFCVLISLLKG